MSVVWSATVADQLQAIRDYLARSSAGYAQAPQDVRAAPISQTKRRWNSSCGVAA
jgi:hypothetical protein